MKKTNSIVSIPQAVSTVATKRVLTVPGDMTSFNTASGKYCCNNEDGEREGGLVGACFNTASGKYCCNFTLVKYALKLSTVSIPQAVSTVATIETSMNVLKLLRFNTASGKYCCNY